MAKQKLSKVEDRIRVQKFHVPPLNVRAGEPFGEAEEDRQLIAQLRRGKSSSQARPEGDGYSVFIGRRRFLAKKEVGAKYFVVGADYLIKDVSDKDAREALLIENLEILRKKTNPITRAKALKEIISLSTVGL